MLLKLFVLWAPVISCYGQTTSKLLDFSNLEFYQSTEQDLRAVEEANQRHWASNAAQQKNRITNSPPRWRTAYTAQIQAARALVKKAEAAQAAYNKWNIENPHFNVYGHKGAAGSDSGPQRRDPANEMAIPKLSEETIAALELLGEIEAQEMHDNGTFPDYNEARFRSHNLGSERGGSGNITKRATGGYWLGQVAHDGTMPFGGDSSYKVWRNVLDYGAKGDGVTDDTTAIQRAISDGNRCGANCAGSTVKSAVVYFPYGVYRVSRSIISYYDTQIVGEIAPLGNMPVIMPTSEFKGNGVFDTDVYFSDGVTQWYLNTANFYRQLRNFNIDMRLVKLENAKAIHWQVAQATSLENIKIFLTDKASSTQVGVFAENGSGGWISDITVEGGLYGFLGGNQQYSVSNLGVRSAKNGVGLIWDWAWSWTRLSLMDCDVGIDLTAPGSNSASPVGSIMIVDSYFTNCPIAVLTYPIKSPISQQGTTVLGFNNVRYKNCGRWVAFLNNLFLVKDVSDTTINYIQLGKIANGGPSTNDGWYDLNIETRPSSMTEDSGYTAAQKAWVKRSKPLYYQTQASTVINAKALAKGDGKTDDTAALQNLLNQAAQGGRVLYIPGGSYMISSPLLIPSGSAIVGEGWSQLVAYGSKFADENNPRPMVTVGNGGEGTVEIQNLLFTSQGALPGLVLMYWDIKAKTQGSAAMWDCHFRVGGAKGTNLQIAQCPKLTGGIRSQCIAGQMMFYMSGTANGYFENIWGWVADHDIDDPHSDMSNQIDVFFGRGMTIRGDGPSWFRGTSSEHSYLYQYNIANAKNIYMSIIQTESPYYQGAAHTQTPALFNREKFVGDPVWDMCGSATVDCNVAWALLVQFSERIYIDGAGLYSWFKDYKQDCVKNNSCQQRLVNIYNVGKLYLNHVSTIGAVETLTPAISNMNNEIKYAKDHLQATGYPWWATIATYLDSEDMVNLTSPARFPIKEGFVSFGDSYAAGIGAGKPLDKVDDCSRGRGSYMAILNQIIRFSHDIPQLDWQPLACSGETAAQFLKGGEKGKQMETWQPASSDLATVSFTGNDLGFGDIVSHCIMGYPYGSRSKCQGDIASAASKIESGLIGELVAEVMDKIIGKAYVRKKDRFVVYWTGYPKFFTVADTVCDTSYFQEGIWAGEYLTTTLRNQLNELSVRVNDDIDFAIRKYNAGLPYPKVVFVSPEKLGLYNNKRFCEPGVKETLKSEVDQKKVAFFYDNGYDDIPSESESFFMPPKWKDDAPDDWAIRYVTSKDCSPLKAAARGDTSDFDEILCGFAQAIQNGTIKPLDYPGGGGAVTYNRDGSITIADAWVRFNKMFHPKTRANWHIAQAVSDALRRN